MGEIARLYLEENKIHILLSPKNTEALLIALTDSIEDIYADAKNALNEGVEGDRGTKGVKLNLDFEININAATKARVSELKQKLIKQLQIDMSDAVEEQAQPESSSSRPASPASPEEDGDNGEGQEDQSQNHEESVPSEEGKQEDRDEKATPKRKASRKSSAKAKSKTKSKVKPKAKAKPKGQKKKYGRRGADERYGGGLFKKEEKK